MLLYIGFLWVAGCSGNGVPIIPGIDNSSEDGSLNTGLFRGILWTVDDPDEEIADELVREKCADITNVVYGNSYYPINGEIVRIDEPDGNEYTDTVVAYQISDAVNVEWDIYFRLTWRFEGDDYVGNEIEVDPCSDYDKIWPSVTAHLYDDGEDDLVVVDIAYMKRHHPDPDPYNWEIYHARYIQDEPGSDDFTLEDGPNDINPSAVYQDNCITPDIVFDGVTIWTVGEVPRYNFLHVTAAILWEDTDRDIWYKRGYETSTGGLDIEWDDEEAICNEDSIEGPNGRPRIDVGWDDTGYFDTLDFPYEMDHYYVGVVWHYGEYDETSGWMFDIYYTMFPAEGDLPSELYSVQITDQLFSKIEIFPYIDIEPIENTVDDNFRCTFITWSRTFDFGLGPAGGWNFCTNTFRLANSKDNVDVFNPPDGPPRINGLNAFAATADSSNSGYFVWLNDSTGIFTDIEVYAGDILWDASGPTYYIISSLNYDKISIGKSALAPDDGMNFAPEIAIFDEDVAKCVWTDIDNGDPPSIWGDNSDWQDS